MIKEGYVAVKATEERYRVLRHVPSNAGFDENGEGLWPADQFTFRLRNEGSITIDDGEAESAPNASEKRK